MRLLRVLAGQLLPCGCLVGIYETYDGRVVASIDARGYECKHHHLHQTLSTPQSASQSQSAPAARPGK